MYHSSLRVLRALWRYVVLFEGDDFVTEDKLFNLRSLCIYYLCFQCLEYDTMLSTDPNFRKFAWHIGGFFHWVALLVLLLEIYKGAIEFDLIQA
jgi:hypothetical protein